MNSEQLARTLEMVPIQPAVFVMGSTATEIARAAEEWSPRLIAAASQAEPPGAERRRSRRVSWIELVVRDTRGTWAASGNLSDHGCAFASPHAPELGDRVIVSLALESSPRTPLSLIAIVRRLERREAAMPFWVGASFEEVIPPELAAHLNDRRRNAFWEWLEKEYPAHPKSVSAYLMSRYPITNAQYRSYLENNPSMPVPRSIREDLPGDHPVWPVDREDALRFISWLNGPGEQRFRLPTEAEWEYAAKGPSGREYPFGDAFDATKCNTAESSRGTTTSVHQHEAAASELGICDLAGNVEEWTSGDYAPYPGGRFVADYLLEWHGPGWPILRGGSFLLGGDSARSARRHGPHPDATLAITGFRVCCSA